MTETTLPPDFQLSRFFTVAEFTRSATAARMGRKVELPTWALDAATRLCTQVLDPLRRDLRKPVVLLSGFRPEWLNKAVGGSPTSDHMAGRAADLIVPGMTPAAVAKRILALDGPYSQVILEFDEWVHVSVAMPSEKPKRQALTARKVNGKTVYTKGIA